jgi:dTDP-4-dehydrorhamnose 3,5-epimerase-like enzyme
MIKKVKIIEADVATDDRGELMFSNKFNMSEIKRFYQITNFKTPFVRAWHGHKHENKYILVLKGVAMLAVVKIDNWKKPNKKLKIQKFVLNDKKPKLLFIPGGHAHGFKTLQSDTRLIVFSTSSINESKKDDYRFQVNYWNPWKVTER